MRLPKVLTKELQEALDGVAVSQRNYTKLFFTLVGMGISFWAAMEEDLVKIVALLMRTSQAKAGLVMYSIINFYVWINVIDELLAIEGADEEVLTQWRSIAEALKTENDIRVRLAHHFVH